jgi:hypothetical protein
MVGVVEDLEGQVTNPASQSAPAAMVSTRLLSWGQVLGSKAHRGRLGELGRAQHVGAALELVEWPGAPPGRGVLLGADVNDGRGPRALVVEDLTDSSVVAGVRGAQGPSMPS